MMTAEQLKNSILQLALQGDLIPQSSEDQPASVLLKIDQQKKKKNGRRRDVKKKVVEQIRKDEKGEYFETREGKRVSVQNRIPFDIPDSWEWIHLGYVCDIARGGSPRPIKNYLTEDPDGINWIKIGDSDIGGKYINSTKEKIIPEGMKKSRYVQPGDFLLTNSMSFGRPYILNCDGCIHDGWLVLTGYKDVYDKDFLYYMLFSGFAFNQFCDVVSGAVVKNLNSDKVADAVFPVPPFEEQKRIVAKIEELMPFVEQYAAASTKLNTLNASFSEMMKKSILQEAVQGKLVEQRPEEGTGTELYEIIRNDKKSLMKSKIIKKEKPLPEIKEEDIPFDIPDSWVWVRIGLISNSLFAGGDKPKDFTEKPDRLRSIPVVANGVSNNGILGYTSVATAKANTITVAGRGTIGFSVFREYEYCPIVRLIVIEQNKNVFPQYLQYALQALPEKSLGTSIPQLTVPMLYPKLIPLPPLAEQKRIVAKIEELMPFITELGSGVK